MKLRWISIEIGSNDGFSIWNSLYSLLHLCSLFVMKKNYSKSDHIPLFCSIKCLVHLQLSTHLLKHFCITRLPLSFNHSTSTELSLTRLQLKSFFTQLSLLTRLQLTTRLLLTLANNSTSKCNSATLVKT